MRPGKADNSKLPASVSMSCRPRFCSKGTSGTCRAARICSLVQRGDGLGENGGVTVFPPVGLDEDAVDVFEVHDTGLVAHGFDERTRRDRATARRERLCPRRRDEGNEKVVPRTGP